MRRERLRGWNGRCKSLGAVAMDEWTVFRLTNRALVDLGITG